MLKNGLVDPLGFGKAEIDIAFKESCFPPSHPCIVCGQESKYRLIPKAHVPFTMDIEDRGYLCEAHVKQEVFSPNDYGIRQID